MDVASASVDVLCLVPRSLPIMELPEKFIRPTLKRQLAAIHAAMLEEGCTCNLKALHFQPPSWVHPVTILYPLQASAGKVECHTKLPHSTGTDYTLLSACPYEVMIACTASQQPQYYRQVKQLFGWCGKTAFSCGGWKN